MDFGICGFHCKQSIPNKFHVISTIQATTQYNSVSKHLRSLLYGVVDVKWRKRTRAILQNRAAAFLFADQLPL
jgi:hypothetical protein